MDIRIRQVLDVTVADLSGRLGSHAAGQVNDELARLAGGSDAKILVNLDRLDSMSSAGLHSLVVAAKLAQQSGGLLQLCCAPGPIHDAIEQSGFNSLLPLYHSETEAVRGFG